MALLLVHLDGLKSINDRYGHHAGDEAIRGLAGVIRSELRETDTGARWGGDEFAVLAPNTAEPAALALAERIRALIPATSARWSLTGSAGARRRSFFSLQITPIRDTCGHWPEESLSAVFYRQQTDAGRICAKDLKDRIRQRVKDASRGFSQCPNE